MKPKTPARAGMATAIYPYHGNNPGRRALAKLHKCIVDNWDAPYTARKPTKTKRISRSRAK